VGKIIIKNFIAPNVRWIKEEWRTTTARSERKCSLRHFSFNPFVITSAVKLVGTSI
jgi:hypothetical protein